VVKPLRLRDTFYTDGAYPPAVLDRVPRGLYENHACLLYQPTPCSRSNEMTSIVSQTTGLPVHDASAADPIGFGLDLGRAYQEKLGGAYWFYEGMTLGCRVIFAYWPQYDLVITAATNSQPPEGENQFGQMVVGGAFGVMRDAGVVEVGR
jgi:hypothetical protein